MNTQSRASLLLRCCAALSALTLGVCATASAVPTDRVQVSWAPTDKLTEVRDNQMERGWLRPDDWMRSLDKEWRRAGEHSLPAGQQLQVTINDIKLAGSFEPWRRFDQQDIRIMKDIYPPHVDLHYKLLAADGSVIREGDAKLRDGAYLQHAIGSTTDPLRYDKRLINDWVRHEFAAR